MTACASGQLPWRHEFDGSGVTQGESALAACQAMVAYQRAGGTWSSATLGGVFGPEYCHAYGHPNGSYNGQWGIPVQVCDPAGETPSEGNVIQCTGTCTVTIKHEFDLPPFQLSTAEGAQIAGAVLAVWAVGWAFRALLHTLKTTDGDSSTSTEKD